MEGNNTNKKKRKVVLFKAKQCPPMKYEVLRTTVPLLENETQQNERHIMQSKGEQLDTGRAAKKSLLNNRKMVNILRILTLLIILLFFLIFFFFVIIFPFFPFFHIFFFLLPNLRLFAIAMCPTIVR